MPTLNDLKALAIHAAKGTAPADFSVDSVHAALADALKEKTQSINDFERNKHDIFDIIIAAAEEVVPQNVISALSAFAEVRVVPQGQKIMFRRRLGRNRAKQFLTQVGLSGVYETFRLDSETFEVPVQAVGGAITVDFERFLDGEETIVELMDIITEGLTEATYLEVQKALRAAFTSGDFPRPNNYIVDGFSAPHMERLLNVVRAYGRGATIFATPEFISAMGADAIVAPATGVGGVYHPDDIDSIHRYGYPILFRGAPIVTLPQSFKDENNEELVIDPDLAFILPNGGEKVVKVAFEGQTQINDFKNRDNSIEIHTYKKMGASILTHNNWGVYQNTALSTYSPYESDDRT